MGAIGFAAGLVVSAAVAAERASDVRLSEGEVAPHDLYCPEELVVVDTRTTVEIAAKAGQTLPVVIRRDPRVADAVVAEFDAAFHKTHESFLDALEQEFGERQIGSREINSARFRNFRSEFQAANPLFPVSFVMAQTWAKGYDGEPARERLASAMRAVLDHGYIIDLRPVSTVFAVTLTPQDRIRSWNEAAPLAHAVEPADVMTVEQAGLELRRSLDALDRTSGGFLTGLLRANAVEDEYLTGLLLRERLGDKAVVRRFSNLELIARSGERVDRWGALALEQLPRMNLSAAGAPTAAPSTVAAPTRALVTEPGAPAGPAVAPRDALRTRELMVYALLGIGAAAVATFAILILWQRSRRRHHRRPREDRWIDAPTPAGDRPLREALIPHLARELKNRLVQALFAQRQELLHNEAEASERVADLEARLARLQPAIAEKIRDYERRIQALERELEEKDQETRDLIRAKLVLARQELDAEISRHRVDWN